MNVENRLLENENEPSCLGAVSVSVTDLRIGNVVKYDFEKWTVVSVFKDGQLEIYRFGIYKIANISEIKPIHITNKILLEYGFDFVFAINNRYLKDYGSFYFTVMVMNDDISYRVSLSNHENKEGESIPTVGLGIVKYIHQLQNIYFALAGCQL